MNLFAKASEFEKLCMTALKKAQQNNEPFRWRDPIPEASLSGPTPRFKVPYNPEVHGPQIGPPAPPKPAPAAKVAPAAVDQFLNDFASKLISFDPEKWHGVSVDVDAVKKAGNELNTAVQNKKPAEILKALTNVMGLTRDGGGQLYEFAKKIYEKVKASLPKPQAKPKTDFLDRYMAEEKAKEQAEQTIKSMESSLEGGPAEPIQRALNRKPFFPNF